MSEPIQITDDGFISVKFGDNEKSLDLYRTNNELADICNGEPDPIKQGDAIAAFMAEKGFGQVSHKAAFAFSGAIFGAMRDTRKKEQSADSPSETPNSSDSTESTS